MSPLHLIVSCIAILIGIGAYFGLVKIEHHSSQPASDSTVLQTTYSGATVSGTLFRGPKTSYQQWFDLIHHSTGFLDIWMYDITFRNLRDLLARVADRIPVRLILEHQKYKDMSDTLSQTLDVLQQGGVVIHDDSLLKVNFMHAKTLVSANFAMIQTSNLTKNSFDNNREYYFVTQDQKIIHNLHQLFEKDRIGEKIGQSDIDPALLVCPIDCRSKIIGLIQTARHSITIQNQSLDDQILIDILNRRITEGIQVKIIVADKDGADILIPKFPLATVRKLKKPYPHAKMMLIDDHMLMVASINFTTNSMDNNREIGILTDSKSAVQSFAHNFAKDRQASKR